MPIKPHRVRQPPLTRQINLDPRLFPDTRIELREEQRKLLSPRLHLLGKRKMQPILASLALTCKPSETTSRAGPCDTAAFSVVGSKGKSSPIKNLPPCGIRIRQLAADEILALARVLITTQHALKVAEELGHAALAEVFGSPSGFGLLVCNRRGKVSVLLSVHSVVAQ